MDRIPSPTKYIGQLKRQRYMRIYGCSPRICTAIYIFRLLVMVYMRALALVVAAVDCLLLHSHSCTAQFIRYLHMHCTGHSAILVAPTKLPVSHLLVATTARIQFDSKRKANLKCTTRSTKRDEWIVEFHIQLDLRYFIMNISIQWHSWTVVSHRNSVAWHFFRNIEFSNEEFNKTSRRISRFDNTKLVLELMWSHIYVSYKPAGHRNVEMINETISAIFN